MKHIEVSKKISLSRDVDVDRLKTVLMERLEKVLVVEKITGGSDCFQISATTGSPSGIARHARLDLSVAIGLEGDVARIIVDGYARPALSLTILYTVLFFFFLLAGLLPGFIETNADKSGAVDALVFLIFGIYIVTDVNKKLAEPHQFLESALESLNTTFG